MTAPTPATRPELHVVVGAGPVGSALARQLLAAGHRVRVLTRSGSLPVGVDAGTPGLEIRAVDAADADALTAAAEGAAVLYNATNPKDYHRWQEIWPPVAASLLAAAERTGAVLAVVGNLYPYGAVAGAMSEQTPDAATYTNGRIRAEMWADARARHEAGRIRAVEVRASDYIGQGTYSHPALLANALLAGRTVRPIGDPDQPHTWTSTEDTARTLIAAAADPGALGRTWIVPSNPPRTQRELVADLAAAAGRPMPKVAPVRLWVLRLAGVVVGQMRALVGTYYQFAGPFVVDDRAARERFGIEPTPWPDLLADALGRPRVTGAAPAASA